MQFDYKALPREFPRRYVPDTLKFQWESLEGLFAELGARTVVTASDLERWLRDESELASVVFEERALRSVLYTTQTDNAVYERSFQEFIQELEPRLKAAKFELDRKFVASPAKDLLPGDFYRVLVRSRTNGVSLFREENLELEKQDSELAQRYQKTCGALVVSYAGAERTLQQMERFQEEPDRHVREEAWALSEKTRLAVVGELNQIYDDEVKVRAAVAKNAGFPDFRDYTFRKLERFDYTPEDCYEFHAAVEKHFVPLRRQLDRQRAQSLGVDKLRPWDLEVDPEGRPPLRPFDDASELVGGCSKVFRAVDPEFAGYFQRLADLNLLDLESRKGKAPGGYQTVFANLRLPFIFTNAVGMDKDVRTLCHEAGHSFHTSLVRSKDFPLDYLFGYGAEIAEVASISMELISGEHYEGVFYDAKGARRSNHDEAADMVRLLCWIATVDSFQHWVYTNPDHTREEREEEWLKVFRRFKGLESWEGYEESERNRWQRQLHLFEYPFYYIEYGIATLGALGIWTRYRREPKEAIAAYRRALSLGGSRPLPELFEAAGLPWGFGASVVERYAEELKAVTSKQD